ELRPPKPYLANSRTTCQYGGGHCPGRVSRMNSFWQTWRKEIIRGVVLFCGVIAIGLCIRYVVVRARQGVMDNLPVALRGLRGLRDLKNLPNNFDFDPDAYGGPRDTADTWTYQAKVVPQHWVWIRNTVGSVRVEAAKGDSLEVVAVKTHRRSDPGSVHIETVKVADGIAICAVWAHGRASRAAGRGRGSEHGERGDRDRLSARRDREAREASAGQTRRRRAKSAHHHRERQHQPAEGDASELRKRPISSVKVGTLIGLVI